jgi:hypothetical protein
MEVGHHHHLITSSGINDDGVNLEELDEVYRLVLLLQWVGWNLVGLATMRNVASRAMQPTPMEVAQLPHWRWPF